METQRRFKQWTLGLAVFSIAWMMGVSLAAGQGGTYTLDADFNEGLLVNVNHDDPNHDQLQLNVVTTPFPFVNIACSNRGTLVRIDVNTGAVLGEYRTAPDGMGKNPSRTTVDLNGNVWVANRNEFSGGKGSVTRVGLVIGGTRVNADGTPNPVGQYVAPPFQYNTCVDQDGDGLIKTSRALGNYLPWTNAGGADTNGGVSTADDECIINYTRVTGTGTRTVAIDANNDVWVGGCSDRDHEKLNGVTGLPVSGTQFNLGCGGYGGLIDGNGVLWSARCGANLLRYVPSSGSGACLNTSYGDYGLGIDPQTGNIWHTNLSGNRVAELAPDGTLLNAYSHGNNYAQGVAVDGNSNVWVAHSLIGPQTTVGHLRTDGTFVGNVPVGSGPTGVAIDANGKVWVANYNSHSAMRIDPSAGPIGGGGFPVGAVDLTVDLNAAGGPAAWPYNYSDMTGFVSIGSTAPQGTWTVVFDTGSAGTTGCTISWNGAEPQGTSITVEARADDVEANLPAQSFVPVTNGSAPNITGQFVEVRVTLARNPGVNDTPVLYDLTIQCCEPVEDPDVRTQGFWKRVCRGPHPSGEHENLPDYVDCVSATDTFGGVDDVDDLCDHLTPNPRRDKCEQAEAQFMALLLNLCSGRVETCNCVADDDLGETTVGEAGDFIDDLLSNPDRTFQDCVLAQAIADRINNGETLVDCP